MKDGMGDLAKSVRVAAILAACSPSCSASGGVDLPHGSASAAEKAVGSASASAEADAGPLPNETTPEITDWREATRLFRFERAEELLAAMKDDERGQARVRLARGWVALQAGRYAEAVEALGGLAEKLPLAKSEIESWYAEAAAHAGPYDQAGALLGASPLVRDNILGAQAYLRGGDLGKARVSIDTAIRRAERNRRAAEEAEAHWVRAQIAEAQKQPAVAAGDYRWLVENAPKHDKVREAIEGVDRNQGTLSLDARLTAIARSTSPLNLDQTLVLLASLEAKHPESTVAHAFARARALYAARDYARARDAFDAAAKLVSPFAAEALYYAAHAAARAGDEGGGLTRYAAVSKKHAGSVWAERSAYRHAELLLTTAAYDEAAAAFASYAARFPKTQDTERAHYGRAMALLSGGEPARAAKLFKALRDKASQRHFIASLSHLEGVALSRAGKLDDAKKLWLELVREEPLTWAALAAHARLRAVAHAPMPPLIGGPDTVHHAALPITLPSAPRMFHELGLDMIAEERLSSMEQEAARPYPSREGEALCEMYGQLSVARQRSRVGNRAVSLEMLMRPPSSAERWAWHCVYPQPYADLVRENERRFEIPSGVVHAIMRQESAFKTTALSPVGAQGLMQLMPNTAARVAAEIPITIDLEDVWQPDINLQLGSFYIGKLLQNFKGSVPIAAAAYNAGPHAVQRWLEGNGDPDLDVWIARIPYRETRTYVQRVVTNFARYQYLTGGRGAVRELDLKLPAGTTIEDDAY